MQYKITGTWLSKKPNQIGFLIAAITTFFLAVGSVLYWQNWNGALSWMPLTQDALFVEHSWWRTATALFAHSDGKHLLSNVFLFFILGSFLAGYFGAIVFPLMAFVFGAVINVLVVLGMEPQTRLLGASGIVFWMGGMWLVLYGFLDQKRSVYQRTLRVIGVALALFFPAEAFDPQTSYVSHLLGFILGIFFGIVYYRWNRKKFQSAVTRELVIEEPDNVEVFN